MFRFCFAVMTIASLLLCPLRCVANELAGERGPQATCGCCVGGEDGEAESPLQGDPGEGDCGCGDCLCHGAILEQAKHDLTGAVALPVPSTAMPLAERLPARAKTRWAHVSPRPVSSCGRAVCLQLQSLQL